MLPAVHDTGSGDTVLFLHAFPLDGSQWDHQVAALSGEMRCVRVDMWGCGTSPAPPSGEPSLDDFAGAVLAALDSRGIDHFAVVGMSMGGYLAFALWRLAAERIRALALCNTRASTDDGAQRQARLDMVERVERDQSVESIVEPMIGRLLGPGGLARRCTSPTRCAGASGAVRRPGSRSPSAPWSRVATQPNCSGQSTSQPS